MDVIRVLIVDEHAIVREGLRTLIASGPEMELVGEASDGSEFMSKARALQPDVILTDLPMPPQDTLTAIRQITEELPGVRILVHTSSNGDDQVFAAIKTGAWGYLLKGSMPEVLLQAIKDVYRGRPCLQPAVARKLLQELKDLPERTVPEAQLTAQEIAVLVLAAQGLTNREIAGRLGLSDGVVDHRVCGTLGKLHLAGRAQAAVPVQHGHRDMPAQLG
jgi:DNA-binding NarL/FixJ family response regulator